MKQRKKSGLASSDALLRHSMTLRVRPSEVLPPRLANGEHRLIEVAEFKLIDIDERYQRPRIGHEVNDIIVAIRRGGGIGQDIHLARRAYEPNGKLWVVDGQQRWWACYDTCFPFPAKIHQVESLEDEMLLFRVLNAQVSINANVFVNAHSGPIAERIKKVNTIQDHPLFGRVQLNDRTGGAKLGAGLLVSAINALLTGSSHSRKAASLMAACDQAFIDRPDSAPHLVSGFLWLVGELFPAGYVPSLPLTALALVARDRWGHGVLKGLPQQPTPRELASLKKINWATIAPSYSRKWLSVVRETIERRWKR